MENVSIVEKRTTERLIFGHRKMRKKTTLTTYLWGTHYTEKFRKVTTKKNLKNGWEKEVYHCTLNNAKIYVTVGNFNKIKCELKAH